MFVAHSAILSVSCTNFTFLAALKIFPITSPRISSVACSPGGIRKYCKTLSRDTKLRNLCESSYAGSYWLDCFSPNSAKIFVEARMSACNLFGFEAWCGFLLIALFTFQRLATMLSLGFALVDNHSVITFDSTIQLYFLSGWIGLMIPAFIQSWYSFCAGSLYWAGSWLVV